jgi:hypothetical protein
MAGGVPKIKISANLQTTFVKNARREDRHAEPMDKSPVISKGVYPDVITDYVSRQTGCANNATRPWTAVMKDKSHAQ